MKKLVYILLFTLVSTLTISACTEEVVSPQTDSSPDNGGGGSTPDPFKL